MTERAPQGKSGLPDKLNEAEAGNPPPPKEEQKMLNFEKMKATLTEEKTRLETIIEAQGKLLPLLQKMDKKIFNKKITDYINEGGEKWEIRAYIENRYDRKEFVIYHKKMPYNDNNIFDGYAEFFCDEKRFSYEKFKALLTVGIARKRAELAAIEADLADGEKRAKEFNYVQEYYKSIVKTFSAHIRYKFHRDFEIGYIG